jgi:hypothetical protein
MVWNPTWDSVFSFYTSNLPADSWRGCSKCPCLSLLRLAFGAVFAATAVANSDLCISAFLWAPYGFPKGEWHLPRPIWKTTDHDQTWLDFGVPDLKKPTQIAWHWLIKHHEKEITS